MGLYSLPILFDGCGNICASFHYYYSSNLKPIRQALKTLLIPALALNIWFIKATSLFTPDTPMNISVGKKLLELQLRFFPIVQLATSLQWCWGGFIGNHLLHLSHAVGHYNISHSKPLNSVCLSHTTFAVWYCIPYSVGDAWFNFTALSASP